jgi:hypothetical protein
MMPSVIAWTPDAALSKPCLDGGGLLLGRHGFDAELELRRELGRDSGDGTLAA